LSRAVNTPMRHTSADHVAADYDVDYDSEYDSGIRPVRSFLAGNEKLTRPHPAAQPGRPALPGTHRAKPRADDFTWPRGEDGKRRSHASAHAHGPESPPQVEVAMGSGALSAGAGIHDPARSRQLPPLAPRFVKTRRFHELGRPAWRGAFAAWIIGVVGQEGGGVRENARFSRTRGGSGPQFGARHGWSGGPGPRLAALSVSRGPACRAGRGPHADCCHRGPLMTAASGFVKTPGFRELKGGGVCEPGAGDRGGAPGSRSPAARWSGCRLRTQVGLPGNGRPVARVGPGRLGARIARSLSLAR